MSETSAVLSLPYIQPSQAQKHVTHNEALRALDVATQLSIEAREIDVPPPGAAVGSRYAVGQVPTGFWAGQPPGTIASREDAAWHFVQPLGGWLAYDRGAEEIVVFDSAAGWQPIENSSALAADTLGLNANADGNNRLTVAAAATLFTHDGSSHQVKVNKAGDGDTASLLFQSGYTGHAEMGLVGGTDFAIKTSADGGTFVDALRIGAADGLVTGTAIQQDRHDTGAGKLMPVGAFGLGQDGPTEVVTLDNAILSGFFNFSDLDPARPSSPGGAVLVIRYAGQSINQMAFASNDASAWLRGSGDNGGTWSAWAPVFTTANIVGTVSQSSGVPTGTIIEQGSTANGNYVRFADGTQICTQVETLSVATSPTGALYRDNTLSDWTYPMPFIDRPSVTTSCESSDCWADVAAVDATSCGRVLWSAITANGSHAIHAQAIGRWF